MEHKFNEVNFQGKSPFFLKLNADIRRLIYIQLFGKFLVHICGTGEPTWNLESRPPGNILGLWHCICPGGRKEIPHYHSPETHEWRFLATNLLFSCKRIYEEGISILYRKNSFLFELSADVIVFNFQAKQYLKHIRNIDLCVDYDDVLYNYTWLPDLRAACIAISQLEKLVLRIRVPEVLATLTNDELERAPEEIAKAFSEAIEWHCAKSVEIILPEILHGQVEITLRRQIKSGHLKISQGEWSHLLGLGRWDTLPRITNANESSQDSESEDSESEDTP